MKLLEDEECRKFQSTPPRGWRHGDTKDEKWKQEISIHSTTRVETVVMIKLPLSYIISIHSTTRVETSVDIPTDILYLNFNPLHHEGGDPVIAGIKDEDTRFQSTPPRGWRHGMEPNEIGELLFQSTPPRGWRRILTAIPGVEDFISIHSTTRVETYTESELMAAMIISIHSTTRVETASGLCHPCCIVDFNPLHHEGGDELPAADQPV